jgi:hypothetical protein
VNDRIVFNARSDRVVDGDPESTKSTIPKLYENGRQYDKIDDEY